MLLIEKSISNNRLSCNSCEYFYPLDRTIINKIVYKEQKKIDIVEQGQDKK
jgi:DNA-directed RNA polymerase subunit M/transcription elongation factor TFIIS